MSNIPNNEIGDEGREPQGRVRMGLQCSTATMDDCMEALFIISEGHLSIQLRGDRYAFVGKTINGAATVESKMIAYFFSQTMADPLLADLPSTERLATTINRLASALDAQEPPLPGKPSHMQILATIQGPDIRPGR